MTLASAALTWTFPSANALIRPGQLGGSHDSKRASAAHVIRRGDRYRLYYWGSNAAGHHRILQAESSVARPNEWQFQGVLLEPQPGNSYNDVGPAFPFVVATESRWLLYFCGWGKPRADGKIPNTTGVAISDDQGASWHYVSDQPILPLDRLWDRSGTGSVCVLHEAGHFRMYYTAIGEYFQRPAGVQTGHGDIIPRIGIGYALSDDGIHWTKPLADLLIAPRGFDTEPYEYIVSKPFVVREGSGYRMWVNTFGPAYRVRSLTSPDGMHWNWQPGGPKGDLGVGLPGAFDDHQRCYLCAVAHENGYRGWFTGNGFGASGIGYATATFKDAS